MVAFLIAACAVGDTMADTFIHSYGCSELNMGDADINTDKA